MQAKRPVSKGVRGTMGGSRGMGARLEITFAVLIRREREREKERKEDEEEVEEGTNILVSKRKRKRKHLQLNILKKSFSLLGTKSTINEKPFFIDFDLYILYITFQVIDTYITVDWTAYQPQFSFFSPTLPLLPLMPACLPASQPASPPLVCIQ